MKFREITVLLPCHSLEDFPVYHEGAEADQLLAAWCAPWHPALVASAQSAPNWHRLDMPPEVLDERLLIVPPFVADRLPAGFAARAASEGGHFVSQGDRDAVVAACLSALDPMAEIPLAADFLALGFCRLQIELLTRQMRYSTHIDETHFQNQLVAAANAAIQGDEETSRRHLQQCFDTMYDARKHFYPVDAYLVDLTLLAPSASVALEPELSAAVPINVMATADTLNRLAEEHPAVWTRLLGAIDGGTACILGGETAERELPLLPIETVRRGLAAGADAYEALLGRRPQVYARRRCGLWPGLPQLLVKLGYQGALHLTLDDGRFPLAPQSKTRWEGLDSSVIDVFNRVPCDAAKAESFLSFSRKMADAMDGDHVATVAFAHWPGATNPWYDELRRIAGWSAALGKFMLWDDYFSHTDMPGRLSKFEPDEYRTPYLMQAIVGRQSDAISGIVREHREQADRSATAALGTLADVVAGKTDTDDAPPLARLAALLPRGQGAATKRALVVNPLSFTRRIGVELPQWEHPPAIGGAVVAAGSSGDRRFAVVEVPAMGFSWIAPPETMPLDKRAKPVARENVLANEFFELSVSRSTGGIQSLYSFNQRGNLLSQQLAFRLPDAAQAAWSSASAEGTYTTTRADTVETTASCVAFGEITSRGGLFDDAGRRLAGFRQTTQVWSGSRVIRVEVELSDVEEPRADPWNSYYAARFAWPDETAQLYRGVAMARHKSDAARLEAPEYIDVETASGSLSILTCGLPYHRRAGSRMLDSLLIVRGERARQFSLGIGVELPQPAAAAVELITPKALRHESGPPPASAGGWFFHVDARNVVATHWAPVLDESTEGHADGGSLPVKGFRARLMETAGRPGRVTLRTFRPMAAARQIDFTGQTLVEARVEGDKILLDFSAHEWIEVEAVWSP